MKGTSPTRANGVEAARQQSARRVILKVPIGKPRKVKFISIMTETNPNGITAEIDLAKNIFSIQGVKQKGKAALIRLKVPCAQLLQTRSSRRARLARMTCSGAQAQFAATNCCGGQGQKDICRV